MFILQPSDFGQFQMSDHYLNLGKGLLQLVSFKVIHSTPYKFHLGIMKTNNILSQCHIFDINISAVRTSLLYLRNAGTD